MAVQSAENGVVWGGWGHSRSSAMSPFDRAHTTSYSTSTATMCPPPSRPQRGTATAAKLGRLVLTYFVRCEHSRGFRTEVEFSSADVRALKTSLEARTCFENENPCLEKSGSVLQFFTSIFMLFYINIPYKLIVSDALRIAIKHKCIF